MHIGLHKTGSTAVQHALFNGADRLEHELGILYPRFIRNHSAPLTAMFHHAPETYRINVMEGIDTPKAAARHAKSRRHAFEKAMKKTAADIVLLSGEDVSDLQIEGIVALREWLLQWTDDPRVVCMVRNPFKWAVSAAQSSIRGGRTWRQANKQLIMLAASQRLGKFMEQFGRASMFVFTLEAAKEHPAGIAGYLLEQLELGEVALPRSEDVNRNASMSLEAAYIISHLNQRRPLFTDGKMNPRRYQNDIVPLIRDIPGQPFRLSREAMEKVSASAEQDRDWLKQHFGLELDITDSGAGQAVDEELVLFSQDAIEAVAIKMHEWMEVHRKR